MNAIDLIDTSTISEEEWLRLRQSGIGGSDVAAACGLSRWKSPVELWMEKTGQIEAAPAGEAAYWGQVMEPIVRNEFCKRSGMEVRNVNSMLQHSRLPFMLANLDGLIIDPFKGKGVFEAKTANVFVKDEWENGIPDEYALQVQHYLAVTDLSYACIAVLIGGNTFSWRYIERNDSIIDLIVQLESRFWKHVEERIPPPIDGSNASKELLNRLYPLGKKNTIELPEGSLELIEAYEEARKAEEEANKLKELAANQLKSMLGDNERGVIGDRRINWITVSTDRLDNKALKAAHPEIYAEYLQPSTYRRFTIK